MTFIKELVLFLGFVRELYGLFKSLSPSSRKNFIRKSASITKAVNRAKTSKQKRAAAKSAAQLIELL